MISVDLIKELRETTGAGMMDCKKALTETNGNIEEAIDWLREKGISKAAKKSDRVAAEGTTSIVIKGNTAVILEVNSETDFVAKNSEFISLVDTIGNALIESDVKTLEEALKLVVDGTTISDLITAKTAKIGEKIDFRRFEVLTKEDNQVFGEYSHMGGKISVLTVVTGDDAEVARDVSMHSAAMKPLYISRDEVSSEEIEHERTVLKEQAVNEGKPAEIAEKMVEGRIQKYYKEICILEQPFVKDGDITVGTYLKNNNSELNTMVRYEVGEGIEKKCEDFAAEVMSQMKK